VLHRGEFFNLGLAHNLKIITPESIKKLIYSSKAHVVISAFYSGRLISMRVVAGSTKNMEKLPSLSHENLF